MTAKPRPSKWYYQIGNDIHGPVEMDFIIKELLDHKLQIIHRISADRSNFVAICNEECVEDAVREYIDTLTNLTQEHAELAKESSLRQSELNEKTGKFDLNRVSQGISAQLKDAQQMSESSHNLTSLRQLLSSIAIHRKKMIVMERPAQIKRHVEDENEYLEHPAAKKQAKLSHHKQIIAAISLVVITCGGAYGYNQYAHYKALEQQRLIQETAEKEIQDKILAYYDKILDGPNSQKDLKNSKQLLEVAETMLKQKDYESISKVNDRVLTLTRDKTQRARAYTINGLAQMEKTDWVGANKNFDSAIAEDPNYADALYHQGITFMNRELYPDAEKFLLRALDSGSDRVLTTLALFEAAEQIETKTPDTKFERLSRVDKMIQDYLAQKNEFRAEMLVARISIARLEKNTTLIETLSHEFIDLNPATIQKEKFRELSQYQRVAWSNVYSWCLSSYNGAQVDGLANAVIAGCLVQIQKNSDALSFAKIAFQKLPNDKLVKGLLAYTLQSSNMNEEVKSLVGNDDEKTLAKLSIIALAHVCEKEKTSDCSAKYWNLLSVMDKTDPSAFIGLMNFYVEKNDYVSAKKMVDEGISRQPASADLDRLANKLRVTGHSLW